MEQIQAINPDRIKWCCADLGITPDELASELGIANSSVERVLSGDGGMTFNQLRKLANYFGRGILFFLETGSVDERNVRTPQFRTLTNQKPELSAKIKALIERVEKQRAVYVSLLEDLDEANRPNFQAPKLPQNDIRGAAKIAREWLGLSNENDFDTYRTSIESRGILVFRSNGYNGKWQIAKDNPIIGFSLYYPDVPVIVVKKQDFETKQSFTLIHELAHLLLHKTSSIDEQRDLFSVQGMERDANAFAGHLLVPDEFLSNIQDSMRPREVSQFDDWIKPQRKGWGVSGEVILRRLMDSGRLQKNQYVAYREWWDSQKIPEREGGVRFRHNEPKHMFGDSFVKTVFDSLHNRQITLAKASGYLDNIKITDLHKLESTYAGL
jgi:Zn-dependent peptidase ImmA (M78 family)/plasmid maintenance system antidote protein VapI